MPLKLDTLYYEIEARTTGFGKSLDDAERRVGKLADFIQRRPAVAAGAAAAAILSIGIAATKMAADVEREGRKLGDMFPRVAKQAEVLSNEFGIARTGVIDLFETLRERGARTPESITNAATAVLQLNQAIHGTPDQLDALGASLSDVRDLFHVPTGQEGTLAATLFAMSNGKVPIGDFISDLQAAAPTINAFGLSLNQVGPALVHFREEGLNTSKQINTALKDLVGTQGVAGLAKFGGAALTAADAQKALNDQLARTSEEAGTTGDRVRERFNNVMIDLGTKILPPLAHVLENVVTLMDRMGGRAGAFTSIGRIVQGGNADWLRGNAPADLRNGGTNPAWMQRQMMMQGSVLNLQEQVSDGDISLMELGRTELEALKKSLQEFTKVTRDPQTLRALHDLFTEIGQALAAPEGGGGGAGGSHGGGNGAAGESKVATLTAQLAALSTSVGAVAIDKLTALKREIESALASPAGLSAAAVTQLQALDTQVTNSLGRLTEFQKAMTDALNEATAAKERARQADAKDASQQADARARLKDNARQADAKDHSQLIDDMQRAKDEAGKTRDNIQGQARAIEQAVEGALDLAKAFGLVDEATKNILSNVGQVAAGIGPLVDAIGAMGGKKGTGFEQTANLIGAALPVVGGLVALGSALFGESPGDKAAREAQEKNTAAIEDLTRNVGNLGLAGVTGKGYASALSATAGLDSLGELVSAGIIKALSIANHGIPVTSYSNADAAKLNAYLASQGTSLKELQAMADQLGLTVNFLSGSAQETAAAFKALHDALAKVELTQFAQTFDGQMQAFQASLTLFSVHDPLGQLTRMLDVIRSGVGSPALAGAFAGIDLTSAAGRAEATRRLQGLFTQLQAGTLDPTALGGLTGDEFLNTMTQLKDLLDQLGSASGGQSQSWTVNRSITEVRGARLESLLGSIDLWGQDTAANTALMADLLSRLVIGGGSLQPPDIGPDGRYLGGGGGLTIGQLIIQIAAGVDPTTGGQLAAQALVSTLDRALGTKTNIRTSMMGEAA